ncbi:adipocyte enhancer-binding protein 1-like isoform X3 [Mya arenaria]|uniref:adipocyte enhancer-binding protein 1-like isoform X3 n=1 Tax=Mya arenaria TaxID=6604 RepID=UPI0022E6B787|nr:adipocyte enhancer-binding protein 1-like isoform X3 [Mya arenaria]
MIHRINNIFVISFIVWASCLLLKSTDGSPPQLHVCNLDNESANACCSACAYTQQPGENLGCNISCPADYYVIVDNDNSCNRIREQSTSTAIPTTTITEDPNINETDTSNATNHTIASLKVPDSHYCIRNCASREYYDEQRLKCQLCPTHCLECSDKDNCTTCYVEHDNDCRQECPQGSYQSTKNSAGSITCKESEIESKSKQGFIIGVTVGGVVLVVLVLIVIVMVIRKKRITGKTHWDSPADNVNDSDVRVPNAVHNTIADTIHVERNDDVQDEDVYMIVEIPKPSKIKPDQKTNPDTKQNKDEGAKNKEEDYVTVEIPKRSKADLNEPTKPRTEQTERRDHKEEDYTTVAIPTPTEIEHDHKTDPDTKQKMDESEMNEDDYEPVENSIPCKPKPDNKTNPDTKQNKDESEENEEEVYETVEIPKPSKPTPDHKTKPDTKQNKDESEKNGEEDYVTVEIPKPPKPKPDQKNNPDTKQNKDESEKNEEEDYVTVQIPKPPKPKPDLNEPTKPSTEQTARREHKEEDYMTVKIPTPTKTDQNTNPDTKGNKDESDMNEDKD